MNIGDVAKQTGLSAKMIRYYEQINLLSQPKRSDAGYRVYSQDDIHNLCFIKRSRDLGFSLEQVQNLLALWQDKDRASADVKRLTLQHISDLEAKVQSLQLMISTLKDLSHHCLGDTRPHCPILNDLQAD